MRDGDEEGGERRGGLSSRAMRSRNDSQLSFDRQSPWRITFRFDDAYHSRFRAEFRLSPFRLVKPGPSRVIPRETRAIGEAARTRGTTRKRSPTATRVNSSRRPRLSIANVSIRPFLDDDDGDACSPIPLRGAALPTRRFLLSCESASAVWERASE